MKTQAIFVIRPKRQLEVLVKGTELEGTPFVTEPMLWTCELVDRSTWSRAEVEDGIKLAFLFHLRIDFLAPLEASRLKIDGDLTTQSFDSFWTLETFFDVDQRFEDVVIIGVSRGGFPMSNNFLRAKYESACRKAAPEAES